VRQLLVLALLAISCGSSQDGGTCTGVIDVGGADCAACLESSCGGPASDCYGADWASNHYGGTCAAYTACLCACKVRDTDCEISCTADKSHACASCLDSFAMCEDDSCRTPCGLPSPGDGGV
jgi:hypothetical protein